jgi:signal transduction histidine kinase
MKSLQRFVSSNDIKIVFIALLYFLAANISIWLSFPDTKAISLWIPSGLALALLLLMGYKTWPAITIGSLIAHAMLFLHIDTAFSNSTIFTLAIIAIGNTIEGLIGYYLISKFIKNKNPFLRTGDVFIFLFVAIAMCIIGSAIAVSALVFGQLLDLSLWTFTFSTWCVSNVVSVLIITPFILAWSGQIHFQFNKQKLLETLLFATIFTLALATLRIESLAPTLEKAFPFIIIPFLLWLGYRFSLRVTTLGILLVTFTAIYITMHGTGPFVLVDELSSMLFLQIFIALITVSTIILYATTYERTLAQTAMQNFNEKLETNVAIRTKELEEEILTREQAEKKLKSTNTKLRKTNAELDNFVYRVSHDLRAPIASVLGITNLAKNENDTKELKNYFNMIANSATQQDEFINEIIELSRNARLGIQKDRIKIKSLLNEVFDLHEHSNLKKTIIKNIEIDEQHPLITDKNRLKVILNNIISNSIRHSNGHDPIIKVGVNISEKLAKITIEDNGKGIEKKHIKNIFRMFYRGTDVNAGSGLGLYIVKETVDKLSGTIAIDSTEKEGTSVALEIPNHMVL